MQIDDPYLPDAQADRRIIVYSTTSLAGEPDPIEAAVDRRIIVYSTTSLAGDDSSGGLHDLSIQDTGDWMF